MEIYNGQIKKFRIILLKFGKLYEHTNNKVKQCIDKKFKETQTTNNTKHNS